MKLWLALVVVAIVGVVGRPETARAADECNGLQVCLPVAGPWVIVPGRSGATSTVTWQLRCPLPNYVIAGIDARLTDRALDISIRGESGAPVSPGVTTKRSVLFTAVYTGTSRGPTAFQPFIGCIPTQGGGGRAQTSYKPGSPLERRVVGVRLPVGGERSAIARCPAGSRLVGAEHAVGLRLAADPTQSLLRITSVRRTTKGNAVVATGRVSNSAPRALRVELQVHALCARVTR